MKIFKQAEIIQTLNLHKNLDELIKIQKAAFVDFSLGLYDVPMPMQFVFPEYGSDCHIKGGYRKDSKNLVLKIATASPLGGSGVILVFAVETGILKAMLSDQGLLTTIRTAIAGLIVSELIPWQIEKFGIIGSGNLAKTLYDLLHLKYRDTQIMLYARNRSKSLAITDNICDSVEELITKCDLIFTATDSDTPIIKDIEGSANKAIIALGSDDTHKRELALDVFSKSDFTIVDSKQQALILGDVAQAINSKIISPESLKELGDILQFGIPSNAKMIIADLSGIGAQDVAMVEFVLS